MLNSEIEGIRRPFRTELQFEGNQPLRSWLISGCAFRTIKTETKGGGRKAEGGLSMCPVRHEELYGLVVVLSHGCLERGLAMVVRSVDVGAVCEEEFCHFFADVPGVQRGVAVPASGVDISTVGEKNLHYIQQLRPAHVPQRGFPGVIFGIHVGAVCNKKFCHARVVGVEQSSPTRAVGGIDIGTMIKEELRHVFVMPADSK